jgi:hypothetical protein
MVVLEDRDAGGELKRLPTAHAWHNCGNGFKTANANVESITDANSIRILLNSLQGHYHRSALAIWTANRAQCSKDWSRGSPCVNSVPVAPLHRSIHGAPLGGCGHLYTLQWSFWTYGRMLLRPRSRCSPDAHPMPLSLSSLLSPQAFTTRLMASDIA